MNGQKAALFSAEMLLTCFHHVSKIFTRPLVKSTYSRLSLPVGGQGIASGFRDAAALAWRLAILCQTSSKGVALSHERILTAWYLERKQQLEKSLAATIQNGEFVTESSPLKIFIRNWSLWYMQLFPRWRHELRLGQRREGLIRYQFSDGMAFIPSMNGGLCVPQVYCKSTGLNNNRIHFTDDVIFTSKKGLFQILVYLKDSSELPSIFSDLSDVSEVSQQRIGQGDITCIVESDLQRLLENSEDICQYPVYTIATGAEFALSNLCINRPEPRYYDPHRLGRELKWHKYTILRPDRFVFASCSTKAELQRAVGALVSYLNGATCMHDQFT